MRSLLFLAALLFTTTLFAQNGDNHYTNTCIKTTPYGVDTLQGQFHLSVNWSTFPDIGLMQLTMKVDEQPERSVNMQYCTATPIGESVTHHEECDTLGRVVVVYWKLREYAFVEGGVTYYFKFEG